MTRSRWLWPQRHEKGVQYPQYSREVFGLFQMRDGDYNDNLRKLCFVQLDRQDW